MHPGGVTAGRPRGALEIASPTLHLAALAPGIPGRMVLPGGSKGLVMSTRGQGPERGESRALFSATDTPGDLGQVT